MSRPDRPDGKPRKKRRRISLTARLRREVLVSAVLNYPTIPLAAKAAGVSESTLRRMLRRPGFLRLVRAGRRAVLESVVSCLGTGAALAVGTLIMALKDPSGSVKVRAAIGLIDANLRTSEALTMMNELDELRRQVADLTRRAGAGGATGGTVP